MRERFQLFVRKHHNGWHTASVLALPHYAAYGPHMSELREQLSEVLARDLALEVLRPDERHHLEGIKRRTSNVTLKAVQHGRLVRVPMRFSILSRPVEKNSERFDVLVPRLNERFVILGEENIEPWAEEIIRGHFQLASVGELLKHQYEAGEQVESLEVIYHGAGRYKKYRAPVEDEPDADLAAAQHPLSALGTSLTAEAKDDRLDRAQFRDAEISELAGILESRQNPNALLVGESGVGKTALVHELASRIRDESVARRLQGAPIWHIPGSAIIAGAMFLGEWQARCQMMIEHLQSERAILFADNILELLTSGSGRTGLNVAQFLLPYMQAGELSVIAEATPDALSIAERLNTPFVRAFQRLPVAPMPLDSTTQLIDSLASKLGRKNRVEWGPGALSSVLDVVARFGDADGLPGSALSLVEHVSKAGHTRINREQVIEVFAKSSGFPTALIDQKRILDVDGVRSYFRGRVVGQDDAMDRLTDLIMLLKAGLNDPQKPLGSFLFMGPTGVGKTESALTLAEYLFGDRKRLVRMDMSEYGYPGSALRLVDGPGGEGELTKRVREQPFSVLLFDEIEKADSGVFDVMLQVLGEGRLTDGTGKTVSFGHTIVIMTSNLGAKTKSAVGFAGGGAPARSRYVEAAERFFRPEFINRIDHLVPFQDLGPDTIRLIARRMLERAIGREGLVRREVRVEFDEAVLDLLMKSGFDPRYGARPMKRAIESLVVVPLARQLVRSETRGKVVRLVVDGDTIRIR